MICRIVSAVLVLCSAQGPFAAESAEATARPGQLRLVPLKDITIADSFWAPKLRVYRERTIPHSWQYLQWELRALRRAAGESVDGELNGTWGEANLYKFLETAAYALAAHPDAALEAKVDQVIELLAKAQQPDGYLHAYVTNSRKLPWDPAFLDGSHDGYVLGHMIEAAIEYQAATGKARFLEIARKAADQAYDHFLGPHGQPGFCGHAELEMALVELCRVTGEPRYLELARAFVEWRGRRVVKPFSDTPRAYFQDEQPLAEQRTLEGHAVRALFFATGVADLAIETGRIEYRLAANRFWQSTAERRMTVTGSVGPRQEHEAFGEDYELPNDGYYESCAACGLADFAQRMFLLERSAESIDVLERVLYNAALHGMGLSGTNSYYQNPLTDRDRPRYNSWVCCPPNLSRTLLQVGRYAYAQSDREIYINLFIGGTCDAALAGGRVRLRVATDYPWEGRIRIQVQPENGQPFALCMRRPGWCETAEIKLNGEPLDLSALLEGGYIRVARFWKPGDHIELNFPMSIQRQVAHPAVSACQGRVAVTRGPLVYGFEGLDNLGEGDVSFGEDPALQVERRPGFLGGVSVIRGHSSEGPPVFAIPFYALANRENSSQRVWVKQLNLRQDPTWWMGRLYRPLPLSVKPAVTGR